MPYAIVDSVFFNAFSLFCNAHKGIYISDGRFDLGIVRYFEPAFVQSVLMIRDGL